MKLRKETSAEKKEKKRRKIRNTAALVLVTALLVLGGALTASRPREEVAGEAGAAGEDVAGAAGEDVAGAAGVAAGEDVAGAAVKDAAGAAGATAGEDTTGVAGLAAGVAAGEDVAGAAAEDVADVAGVAAGAAAGKDVAGAAAEDVADVAGVAAGAAAGRVSVLAQEQGNSASAMVTRETVDAPEENAEEGGVEACLRVLSEAPSHDEATLQELGGYEASARVRKRIERAISSAKESGNEVGFVMIDIATGRGLSYNRDAEFYSASSIKGPYITSIVRDNPEILDWEEYTLSNVLTHSDNNSYDSLCYRYMMEPLRELAADAGFELEMNAWFYADLTATEMARLWLLSFDYFENGERGAELGAMFEEPAYSAIHSCLGKKYITRSKGGWLLDYEYCVTNDAGIVYAGDGEKEDEKEDGSAGEKKGGSTGEKEGGSTGGILGDRPYVMVIMSDYPERMENLNALVYALDQAHREM